MRQQKKEFTPLSYKESDTKAREILERMTDEEKFELVCGGGFIIKGNERLGLKDIAMFDASMGVHLRPEFPSGKLTKTVAFPCSLTLAATWNKQLVCDYANAVAEECRAGGIHVLLGPGMNIYRISQCGRNFEYLGEDPYLAGEIIARYVESMQSLGVMATLKHFICNNTDWYRRCTNSVVGQRALNEIYLPAFKKGVEAGARAVMTAYNYFNGEYCGQSKELINDILREQLGFEWLVMTDWGSVDDGEKVAKSGQDLEMPSGEYLKKAKEKLIGTKQIDRMAQSILRACCSMGLYERQQEEPAYLDTLQAHEKIALQTNHEGIVLLKNDGVLPIKENGLKRICITGTWACRMPMSGGGAACVKGYDNETVYEVLKDRYNYKRIVYISNPTPEKLQAFDYVIVCTGYDTEGEGMDRPFELLPHENALIARCAESNPNTIVCIIAGGGVELPFNDKVPAILHAFYGGQTAAQGIVDILSGKVNPSGKLPVTIEKKFSDSPGYGYIPEGGKLYEELITNFPSESERPSIKTDWPYDVHYKEGVLVGYRWYDTKNIEPQYCFGHGLSYTTFAYDNMTVEKSSDDSWTVKCTVTNAGERGGAETVQLYVKPPKCPLERPEKELKGFDKIFLKKGKSGTVSISVKKEELAYYNDTQHQWTVQSGRYAFLIGASSRDIRLSADVEIA